MPNEPPTLPVSTRTFDGSTFRMSLASRLRSPNAPWEPTRSVHLPSTASYSAMAARGSSADTITRLLTISRRVTWAAFSNASATAGRSP